MEIGLLQPQLFDDFLKDNLLSALMDLLTLPVEDLPRFHEFINLSFGMLSLRLDQQQSEQLIKYLVEHEEQCCSIKSVFLVEFLLKLKPHSAKLIETLRASNKITSTVINIIDCKSAPCPSIDLKIFKNLSQTTALQSSCRNSDQEQASKRPRLDEGNNISNLKVILNALNSQAQKLLNFPRSTFDDNDFVLMRSVKNTIEKCLTI